MGRHRHRRFSAASFAAAVLTSAALVGLFATAPPPAGAAPLPGERTAPVILIVGDSISAGYGLEAGQGWVDLLAARLRREGFPQRVVNASISGDTTAGGRARLPPLLREYRPAIVVVELGGNDGLRGSDLAATRANLAAIVKDAQAARAQVLLLGMKLPPNYGPSYVRDFDAMFADVARARGAVLVPWLFAGFGENLALFQPDRIHPLAAAQPQILDNVWPELAPLLAKHGRVALSADTR